MFGTGSPVKENHDTAVSSGSSLTPRSASLSGPGSIPDGLTLQSIETEGDTSRDGHLAGSGLNSPRSSQDHHSPGAEKKRRSSGIAKAGALLSHAKNSFHLSGTPHSSSDDSALAVQPSAIQKLGKTDPVLNVPQGSLNNSAGESRPGPRSTFRIGVTEDRNKKCRRTMEDTHAYLYNFLSTPAPHVGSDSESQSSGGALSEAQTQNESHVPSLTVQQSTSTSQVVETDNGYFAIFDGHAGTFAADWCGKKLHVLLEEMIRKNPNTPIPELLDQTFTNVDQQLDKLPLKNSGCTAICAVLRWEDRVPNSQSATGSTAIAPAAAAAVKAASDTPSKEGNVKSDDSSSATQGGNLTPSAVSSGTSIPKLQNQASRQRVLYTANVGDARIVLCRNGKALRLSYDHKGSDENEGKRISNAGGLILNNRVNGVLAVTRALGDAYMKDLVTGHPYTTETVIQPDIDEFLVLACDGVSEIFQLVAKMFLPNCFSSDLLCSEYGLSANQVQLWDVCSDQEAVDLVRHTHDPQIASKVLVDHALSRFSTDNLSCMIVRFDNKALQQTLEHKKEPIGVEGDPASTKRGGLSETDAIVKEARKSLPDAARLSMEEADAEGEKSQISSDVIREEEEKETGPEVDDEGLQKIAEERSKEEGA